MSGERNTLQTGVPGLDTVLAGGVSVGDSLLLVGPPGSGKTTLSLQMAFHTAAGGRAVLYVSTLSEPAPRVLKHLCGFSFFDPARIGQELVFTSLAPILERGLDAIADSVLHSAREQQATLLILDGVGTLTDFHPSPAELRRFVSGLVGELAGIGCTMLLTTSGMPALQGGTAGLFTLCDGILELAQSDDGPAAWRRLRAWKVRGQANLLGWHAARLGDDGLVVHPRLEAVAPGEPSDGFGGPRLAVGHGEIDAMMCGGVPALSSTILAGAPGTGKTLLALEFLLEGARREQPGVLLCFRESIAELRFKAQSFQLELDDALELGLVTIQHHLPAELDVDGLLSELLAHVEEVEPARVVIDNVGELIEGMPDERRHRRLLVALMARLRAAGATTLLTLELGQAIGPELEFSGSEFEATSDNVVLLRYVEYRGMLRRILSILKMRDSGYDPSIREYEIHAEHGLRVLTAGESSEGLLAGIAGMPSERRVKRSGGEDEPS